MFEVVGLLLRLPEPLQLVGQSERGPEQSGAVILEKLGQPGLLHQSAEFDQLSGAGAPILHPLPLVVTGACQLQPDLHHPPAA